MISLYIYKLKFDNELAADESKGLLPLLRWSVLSQLRRSDRLILLIQG